MDEGSKLILDLILAKRPDEVDEIDRATLLARRSYLTDQQVKTFGLEEAIEAIENPAPATKEEGTGTDSETGEPDLRTPAEKRADTIAAKKALEEQAKA